MVVCAEDVAIAKVHSESSPAFADYGFDYRGVGRDTRWFQMGVSFDCVSESLAFTASPAVDFAKLAERLPIEPVVHDARNR